MIENLVVIDSPFTERDIDIIFDKDLDVVIRVPDIDLSNLMVTLGIYPSTSKARNAGRVGKIPLGYTEYKASKKRMLYIWNPSC